jgi:hypothetical protein
MERGNITARPVIATIKEGIGRRVIIISLQ